MKLYEPFQFLTADECDRIIAYGSPRKKRNGKLIGEGNTDLRNNRVVWYKDNSKWQNEQLFWLAIDHIAPIQT